MARLEARTQAELDAALAKAKLGDLVVVLGDGWFHVSGSSHVEAWGSSHVEAWESSHVVARESSHVVARESSHVEAWESSHVEAWESSHVEARESAHVVAWESSHVVAWESSHVEARESAHVVAWESSHVVAWESSHVEASRYVSVTRDLNRPGSPTISGGVLIEIPEIKTAEQWCDYYGITVVGGIARVYKALDDDFSTANARQKAIAYTPGLDEVTCPDWNKRPVCGGGLHVSPLPVMAKTYNSGATRFVELGARLDELVLIAEYGVADKAKAPRVVGPIVEVDEDRQPVAAAARPRARKAAKA